jgi:hypothetical protein
MSAGTGMGWDGMGRIGIKLEMSTDYGFKNRYLVATLVWLHINQEGMTEILPSLSLWSILLSSQCLELFVSRSMGEVSSGKCSLFSFSSIKFILLSIHLAKSSMALFVSRSKHSAIS